MRIGEDQQNAGELLDFIGNYFLVGLGMHLCTVYADAVDEKGVTGWLATKL